MATNKDTEQCCTLPELKETEKEPVNVAEILRDYKANEIIIYTTVYGNAFLKGFTRDGGIILESTNTVDISLDASGRMKKVQGGECIMFPSAEMRDWNKFFKHGDVVIDQKGDMFVFDCWAKSNYTKMNIIDYFDKPSSFGGNEFRLKRLTVNTKDYQKADEEQRKLFFESMDKSYTFTVIKCGRITMVEKKAPQFKTYDKVLVRNRKQSWKIDLFSHYEQFGIYNFRALGGYYEYCIPFDGNEHLVGKEVKDEEE